jgi:putative phage-type endonuclease
MSLTPEQLEERRSGIGGSDAAVVLGINPFRDPLSLYLDKRGELPEEDDKDKPAFFWGSLLEGAICEAYSLQTGYKVIKQNQMLRSAEHPFMIANLDRRVVGTGIKRGFEAKSDAWGIGWGASGSDEIPAYIMCQVQHYLKVTGWDQFDLGVLIGNRDFRLYTIVPIEEIINQLVEAEQEFWDRVQAGVQPEPTWDAKSTTRLIKTLYPGTNGKVVRFPQVAQAYQDVLNDAKEQRIKYEKVEEGCKNRIAMMMGEASAAILPDDSCYTRKITARKGFTTEDTTFMATRRATKQPKIVAEALENNLVEDITGE